MFKSVFLGLSLGVLLVGCAEIPNTNDGSTIIVDDEGRVHQTVHYLLDRRGRSYFPMKIESSGERIFMFDPKIYAWAAYDEQGRRVMTGSASGGKDFCEDVGQPCRTVTGTFRVYNKRGLNCQSGEYPVETFGGAKMPYCMYFYRGYTIHAAYEVPMYNSSHGCIRVLPSAAKWLNEHFMNVGTKVIVLSYSDEDGDGDWLKYQPRTEH